jgi:hypothetical protein
MMNHFRTSRKQRGHTYKEWNDFFILAEPPTIEIGQPDLPTFNDEPSPDQPEEPHHNYNDEPPPDQPDNDEPHPDQPEQSQHTLNDEQPPPDQPEQSHNLLNDVTIPEEEQETNPQICPARSTSTTTI